MLYEKNMFLLIIILAMMPTTVFASSIDNTIPIGFALAMEAFISIHMSVFVLWPLAEILDKNGDTKKIV